MNKETEIMLRVKKENPTFTRKNIAEHLAKIEIENWTQNYIKQGKSEQEAKQLAERSFGKDWIAETTKRVEKNLDYHKKKDRNGNSVQKYFSYPQNYLSVFRTNNDYYIITPYGDDKPKNEKEKEG